MLPSAAGATAPAAGLTVVGGDDDTGGLLGGPVVGGVLVVAGAEEDVLVAGDDCGGVEDFRALVVGRAARVALGVSDVVPRLVPGT